MAVIIPLISTFNAAGVKAAQSSLSTLGAGLARIGKQALFATGAFQGLQGVINFAGDAITQARDLERNMAALNTVFDDLTPRMDKFVKNAFTMGLSQTDAARTATFLGSVLKQAGLPMDEVAGKTEELTILAQDLATTFGYDTSEALTAMTALFRGEYDPIEKFGVALKQNEVNALVAAKGLGHLTGQEMLNAQQTVRMEQLFLRSADAAGAFARQSGTLFVEQKKLTAVFENMQAKLGSELTPAITDLMAALTPLIGQATPGLQEAFQQLGTIIEDLLPAIEPIVEIGLELLSMFIDLSNMLGPFGKIGLATFIVALELAADALRQIGDIVEVVSGFFEDFFKSVNLDFSGSNLLSFVADFIYQSNILRTALGPFVKILERIGELAGFKKGGFGGSTIENYRLDQIGKDTKIPSATGAGSASATGGGTPARDQVKDFYAELADEIKKQSATIRLRTLGASEELISSIVGSGDDWEKVLKAVTAKGTAGIKQLQAQFNKTATGQQAITKKLEEAAQAAYEVAMVQYRKDLEIFENRKRLYDDQVTAIQQFKDEINNLTSSFIPLSVVTRELGAFESAAVDAFANIGATISDALKDGTLLQDAASSLRAYAALEKTELIKIGERRDELVNRRSLAKGILTDVQAAIIGLGNITSIIEKQTQKVTSSVTKMVGYIKVTTSRTIEEVVNSGGLVSSFQNILEKTRAFATQLKELRRLGLDKNLYKQIVDAGIDAGSTTAEEIIKGGAGTVAELNNLFTELSDTGASIAEETAQVMYGAGVDIGNGIIQGLIDQEQLLVDQATRMADAFITAFNEKMTKFVVPNLTVPNMPSEPVLQDFMPKVEAPETRTLTYSLGEIRKLMTEAGSPAQAAANAKLASELINRQAYTATGTTISIEVNAGLGANGKTIGQAIQAELNKYAKANVK